MSSLAPPAVGVAVLIFKHGKLLLGRRKKRPGYASWQCPGGLLHRYETVFDCARREVLEETGMRIQQLACGPYTNNIFSSEGAHSVSLYVTAVTEDEPLNPEPHLARDWQWFALDNLPQPLFLPLDELVQQHQQWLGQVSLHT